MRRIFFLFSRESDSTITNVCSFVCLSVWKQNPQQLEIIPHSSLIILHHPSSFLIILHSSFLHFATFKLFSLFISSFQFSKFQDSVKIPSLWAWLWSDLTLFIIKILIHFRRRKSSYLKWKRIMELLLQKMLSVSLNWTR